MNGISEQDGKVLRRTLDSALAHYAPEAIIAALDSHMAETQRVRNKIRADWRLEGIPQGGEWPVLNWPPPRNPPPMQHHPDIAVHQEDDGSCD